MVQHEATSRSETCVLECDAVLLTLKGAARAKRYRERKAGSDPGPSLRSRRAQAAKDIAAKANVSVRTVNRYLARREHELTARIICENPGGSDEELAEWIKDAAIAERVR